MSYCSPVIKVQGWQVEIYLSGWIHNANRLCEIFRSISWSAFKLWLSYKKLCSKVNIRTKLLWRVRNFISQDLALLLYRSLIQPHFGYCSFILEGVSQTNINKLQVQQNSALRAAKRVHGYYSTVTLYEELHLDSIIVMMKKSTCKFAYKCFYDLCPKSLNDKLMLYVNER